MCCQPAPPPPDDPGTQSFWPRSSPFLQISRLPLSFVGIALFSPKKGHGRIIFYILRAIYDVNNFATGTNGLARDDVPSGLFQVTLRRIPIAPDLEPNLEIRHSPFFPRGSLPSLPKVAEQKIIVQKLDVLAAETQRLESIYEHKLAALEALKKSLLHQAFTGKL